tara:strand:+ start:308 stop:2092 length:1785 start_codon:yes stop_codon:yes gene_type:complete
MENEKEIALNKDKIKAYERKIKETQRFISGQELEFEKVCFEYNKLVQESVNLVEILSTSKEKFLKTNKDLLKDSKNNDVRMLRRNISFAKNYFFSDDLINLFSKNDPVDLKLISDSKSKLINNYKTIYRFDIPNLSLEESYISSSTAVLDIKQILKFSELFNYCEFDRKFNLNNEGNNIQTIDCLIKAQNDHAIVVEEDKNFEVFIKSNNEKDKKQKKSYLMKYTRGLLNQIEQLSELEYKKNNIKDIPKIDNVNLYIPSEEALRTVLSVEPDIIEFALKKDIEIIFPTTFLAISIFMRQNLESKSISEDLEIFSSIHKLLFKKKRDEIDLNLSKIDQLLKINFEYLKIPSYQIKVTLNHEENYVLEELVNDKGSNKSSVLRQILMEYKDIYKERDSLKLALEKQNLEIKFSEEKQEQIKKQLVSEVDMKWSKSLYEAQQEIKDQINEKELLRNKLESEIDYFKNELVNRTNQYQSENIHLKDKLIKNEEILEKELTLIKESIREKNIEVLTEEKSKNSIKIISPKNLNEFEKIMDLINQNILIICDLKNLSNEEKQRFIDRIYGAIYGLKGNIKEISDNISLYVPQSFSFIDN